MENQNVLSGLIRKRAEITAQVEALQMQLRQLIMDVDNLDGSIRIFAPDIDLADIRPRTVPRAHIAFMGEVKRTTLNALRETGMALTIKDIALRLMAERKLSVSDARLVRLMEKKVGSCLRNLRSRGIVQSEKEGGCFLRWKLV